MLKSSLSAPQNGTLWKRGHHTCSSRKDEVKLEEDETFIQYNWCTYKKGSVHTDITQRDSTQRQSAEMGTRLYKLKNTKGLPENCPPRAEAWGPILCCYCPWKEPVLPTPDLRLLVSFQNSKTTNVCCSSCPVHRPPLLQQS